MNTAVTWTRLWVGIVFAMLAAPASAVELTDFDGKPQRLENYLGEGQWVVVMLWASDCHICNLEAPGLSAFHERHKGRDAIILGVSLDGIAGRKDAEDFMKRHSVSFDSLLIDSVGASFLYARATGEPLRGTPSFLLYAPDGTLAAAQAGAVKPASIEEYMARYARRTE